MNELQAGKLCMLAKKKGFEECQESLVEDCKALIEAAEGEDYDDFIDCLAYVVNAINQVVFALPEEQQEQYNVAVDDRLKNLTECDEDDADEEDIIPNDMPY